MKVMIKYDFPTYNKMLAQVNRNRFAGNQMKKEATQVATVHFLGKKVKTPCKVNFKWFLKNDRRDYDNVAFAKKFILDGMQNSGAIPNDNTKHVIGFSDEFVTSDFWGVEIEVIESGD